MIALNITQELAIRAFRLAKSYQKQLDTDNFEDLNNTIDKARQTLDKAVNLMIDNDIPFDPENKYVKMLNAANKILFPTENQ